MSTPDIPKADLVLERSGWSRIDIPDPATINYAITGYESQVLTMRLQPGDTLSGEPGSMMFLGGGIKQDVSYEGCCIRCCSGECCYVVNFTNPHSSHKAAFAALTPAFPTSRVIPINMSSPSVNGSLIVQTGSYMASYGDVRVAISLDWNCMRCCCAGLGLVRQKIQGTGTAFLSSTGTIVQKELGVGETILVDSNCVLGYAESCKLDLRRAGTVLGMMGGGEGIFNTTLTGPGLVIVQSMNEIVFREALVATKLYRR